MLIRPRILYENRLLDNTPIASSTDAGGDPPFDVENLTDFRPFTLWKPAAMPADVLVNLAAGNTADYFAVYGHDIATQGGTIELQGSNDDFATAGVVISTVTPATDDPIVEFFASVNFTDYKVLFTGATAPTVGIIAFGDLLEIPAGHQQGFDPLGREPKGRFNRSETGAPLGSIIEYEEYRAALEFKFVSWTWHRSDWLPAWNAHLRGNPFIYLWNHQDHPAEIFLFKIDGGYKGPHRSGQVATLSFRVVATL